MSTSNASWSTPSAESQALLEGFVKNLNAYQRELKLYPPEHPRLAKRVQSLLEDLSSCIPSEGDLFLDVRGDLLYINNSPADDSANTQQLLGALRLRMIRAIRIARGVSESEVRCLADMLGRELDYARAGEETANLGPSLDVFFFDPGASVVTSAGGDERADEASPLPQGSEWDGFSTSQVELISKVMRMPHVRQTMQELAPKLQVSAGESFAASLFQTLRSNASTDWEDVNSVRDLVLAGLDLVWRHSEGTAEVVKTVEPGLDPAGSSALTTQLRWVLLQKFFPNAKRDEAPSESQQFTPKMTHLSRAPKTIELTPELEEIRDALRTHMKPCHLIGEFLEVVGTLETQPGDATGHELRRAAQDVVRAYLPRHALARDDLLPLVSALKRLPDRTRVAWIVDVVHGSARPDEVFMAVCHGRADLAERLLATPPDLQKSGSVETLTEAEECGEVLRRLLSQRDKFSLQVIFSILEGPASEHSLTAGWQEAARQTCTKNESLSSWLEANTARLASAAGARFAMALPPDALRSWIASLVPRAPHLLKTLLQQLPARTQSDATAVIEASLACGGSSTVRSAAIEALGTQRDTWSFDLLKQLLRKNRLSCKSVEEIDRICEAIVCRQSEAGVDLLMRVLTEKRLFLPSWNRRVRRAARKALAADRGSS